MNTPKHKFHIKLYSLISLFLFIIANIFNLLYTIYVKLPYGTVNKYTQSCWGLYNTFWSFGYFLTYLLWYNRIKDTFKNSMYDLKKTTSIIFYILLSCYIISQQFNTIIWELFVFLDGKMTWKHFNDIYYPLLWIRLSIDFILNTFIIYLFCSKIYKLTVIKPSPISSKRVFATEHSFKVFETMIKYFILTVLTVISTELFTVSQIILSQSIDHAIKTNNYTFYFIAYKIYYILCNIDTIISTIYILLTFQFTSKYYYKICHYPHVFCVNIWTKSILSNDAREDMAKQCALSISPDGCCMQQQVQTNIVEIDDSLDEGDGDVGGIMCSNMLMEIDLNSSTMNSVVELKRGHE